MLAFTVYIIYVTINWSRFLKKEIYNRSLLLKVCCYCEFCKRHATWCEKVKGELAIKILASACYAAHFLAACLSMDRRLLVFLLLLGKSACNVCAVLCCIGLNCGNRQTHTGFLAVIAAAKSRHGHSHHHHGKKVTRPRAPKPKQPGPGRPGRPGPPRPRKNYFTCARVHADAASCFSTCSTSSWSELHHQLPSTEWQVSAHHMQRRWQLHSGAVHWRAPRNVLLRGHHDWAQAKRNASRCSSGREGYNKLHQRWAVSL